MSQEMTQRSENSGQNSRGAVAAISDVEKLIKVAQILGTVGQTVIPAIVEAAINADKPPAAAPNDPVRSLPKGIHFIHAVLMPLNDAEISSDSE